MSLTRVASYLLSLPENLRQPLPSSFHGRLHGDLSSNRRIDSPNEQHAHHGCSAPHVPSSLSLVQRVRCGGTHHRDSRVLPFFPLLVRLLKTSLFMRISSFSLLPVVALPRSSLPTNYVPGPLPYFQNVDVETQDSMELITNFMTSSSSPPGPCLSLPPPPPNSTLASPPPSEPASSLDSKNTLQLWRGSTEPLAGTPVLGIDASSTSLSRTWKPFERS